MLTKPVGSSAGWYSCHSAENIQPSKNTHSMILLSLLIGCAFVLSVFAGPQAKKLTANNKVDRIWKGKKSSCEKNECSKLAPEEAYNCVNKCISNDCFDEVYADNLLEDGEIDSARSRTFTSCVRQETMEQERERKRVK